MSLLRENGPRNLSCFRRLQRTTQAIRWKFSTLLRVCHFEPEKHLKDRAAEIALLPLVYRYFEKLTGNHGITILLVGGLGDEHEQAIRSLSAVARELVAVQANTSGAGGLHDRGEGIFASGELRHRIEIEGISGLPLHPLYIFLSTGR